MADLAAVWAQECHFYIDGLLLHDSIEKLARFQSHAILVSLPPRQGSFYAHIWLEPRKLLCPRFSHQDAE